MSAYQSVFFLGTACLFISCGERDVRPITERRTLPASEQTPRLHASSQVRFRDSPGVLSRPAVAPPRLVWEVPTGWSEVSGSQMREADFRFGPNQEGQCYVARAGGSLLDNFNRWCQQVGAATLTAQQIAALPKTILFGSACPTLSVTGEYRNVGAPAALPGYRLHGTILQVPNTSGSLFVKMVGPRELVETQLDAFAFFCASLRIEAP